MHLLALSSTGVNVALGVGTAALLAFIVFYSIAEIALFAFSRIRLDFLVQGKHPRAALVQKLVRKPDELLSAILIGNTIAHTVAPVLATLLCMSFIARRDTAAVAASVGMTLAILFVGEIIPKVLAAQRAEQMSLRIAPWMAGVMWVSKPFVWVTTKVTDVVFGLFGVGVQQHVPTVTRDELRHMVGVSGEAGHLEQAERDLLQKVLAFRDKTARDVMIPREKIDALDVRLGQQDAVAHVAEHGFTRIPVFDGELDNVKGLLHSKDLVNMVLYGKVIVWQDLIREPFFVREEERISEILKTFQRHRFHLALVRDAQGRVVGLVTMENILEEIVGEIHDEHDEGPATELRKPPAS